MRGKKRILGVLMITAALTIMQLPKAEADASTSASDFKMEGSTLTRYRGTEKNVSVPDTVEVIGRGAFEDDTNIELVVVPNSVKRIESYAFWGCDNLDTVVLGKGLSEVGDYAFTNCTGLEQISIPSTVTSIGIEAFKDCANLTDITIPPETVEIHETAFEGCPKVTIHYEKGSAAEEYAKEFYQRQKEMPGYEATPAPSLKPSDIIQQIIATPTPAPQETPVPTQAPAEEVTGPVLGMTRIVGNKAVLFLNNTQLQVFGGQPQPEAVSPPEGDSAAGAANLGDSIPKYRVVDGRIVADEAYYRNMELGEMALPEGIVEIGQFAYARSSLTSIVLPQGVEAIDYGAFYHCSQLADVELPDSVMCVEPKAFERTLWVEDFLAGGSAETDSGDGGAGDFLVTGGVLVAYRGDSPEVKVPDGVRVIAGEAFRNHEEIEKVSLPDSLLVVGEGAFEGCTRLGEIAFGKRIEEIKDRAFLGNVMAEVPLPDSVKTVGLQAFGNAVIAYAGGEAQRSHETSATRLSNEAYRIYSGTESGEPGVTVQGVEGASASLEGAARSYLLTLEQPEDTSQMEKAFQRFLQRGIPENMVLYDMTLTDVSEVPLEKLGNQALTVVMPIPEALRGQALEAVILDRNGQLEALPIEQVIVDGVEAVQFEVTQVFMLGIAGSSPAPSGEPVPLPVIEPTSSETNTPSPTEGTNLNGTEADAASGSG